MRKHTVPSGLKKYWQFIHRLTPVSTTCRPVEIKVRTIGLAGSHHNRSCDCELPGALRESLPLPSAIKIAATTTVQSAMRPGPNSTDRRTWLHHPRPVHRNQYRK